MKRSALLVFACMTLLSLSACTIVIGGGNSRFSGATDVAVGEDFSTPALEDVEADEAVFYRIRLSDVESDLVVIEADAASEDDALEVNVYSASGSAILTSTSPDYFGPVGSASTGVSAQQVDTTISCNGPCAAIRPSSEEQIYVSVDSSGAQTFDLYVVGVDFTDETEPNGSIREPASLAQDQAAAIEFVGDEDFFQSENDVSSVSISTDTPELELRFDVYSESGRVLGSGTPGEPFTLPNNQSAQQLIVSVTSQSDRAGVGGSANYGVSFD